MTSAPRVISTTTKLSDEIERRLTASAGYDSFVHCQLDAARDSPRVASIAAMDEAALREDGEDLLHVMTPYSSAVVNGSSKAAHFTWSTRMCRLSGLMSACSGGASKKYDGLRTTN